MRQFVKAFKKKLQFYPYLPGKVIELGSYGIMKGGGFQLMGNIPFPFETKITRFASLQDYNFHHGASTEVQSLVDGDIGHVIGAELKIKFEREKSYSLNTTISASENIVNPKTTLDEGLAKMVADKKWDPNWVIVTSIKMSGNTLWAISKNAGGELVVDCDVKGLNAIHDLAKFEKVGFSVRHQSSDVIKYATDGKAEAILGFELMQYKRRGGGGVRSLDTFYTGSWELVEYNEDELP